MLYRICEHETDPVETKSIVDEVKRERERDLLEGGTVSELDLKLAGLVPSENILFL